MTTCPTTKLSAVTPPFSKGLTIFFADRSFRCSLLFVPRTRGVYSGGSGGRHTDIPLGASNDSTDPEWVQKTKVPWFSLVGGGSERQDCGSFLLLPCRRFELDAITSSWLCGAESFLNSLPSFAATASSSSSSSSPFIHFLRSSSSAAASDLLARKLTAGSV